MFCIVFDLPYLCNQMSTIYYHGEPLGLGEQVATLGFFDGVHLGHQYLIGQVVAQAHAEGRESTVVTFDRHPRQVLHPEEHPQLLTALEDKLLLLTKTGADHVVVVPFDHQLAAMSAREFMQQVLWEGLNVRHLIIGYDNRFGRNRTEGFDDYVSYGATWGMVVSQSDSYRQTSGSGETVSSTLIRKSIEQGKIETANRCLGYPYTLSGKVVSGVQEGRKLGFPTANLDVADSQQLVPPNGVYAVKVRTEHSLTDYHAMMNIGFRPTFNGEEQTIEVHVMNFAEDLYGQRLHVSFLHRIREEQRFESPEALARQLEQDREYIEELFKKENDEEQGG